MLPFDLHVLSLPLAFILSQDQTLRCVKLIYNQTLIPRIHAGFSLFNLFKELPLLSKGAQI
jgi:hypothetical protein